MTNAPVGKIPMEFIETPAPSNVETIAPAPADLPPSQPRSRLFTLGQEKPAYPLLFPSNESSNAYCIDCNNCGSSIPGEHYHCSICDDGDYDLCPACVNIGVTCPGEDHWLLKRLVQNGFIINSTTETIAPRRPKMETAIPKQPTDDSDEITEVKTEEKLEEKTEEPSATQRVSETTEVVDERTCNACFKGES
jgi:next-to-BRCA1 protein 1